ncbi:ABC transporter substrate-binding protein [Microlunatus parietis]|uniref:Iron complex transport system substrate-binding protein n=1 Tax=Microlunatus parietis TaxID=682979 RepID=A0A7Y9LAU7_9ACTN|nr:ABC transporter substrate-binding protein [Microlunatus parietis]NYE71057.1 iron complex transport system substrate-binding protein [Microlunatus parietis]
MIIRGQHIGAWAVTALLVAAIGGCAADRTADAGSITADGCIENYSPDVDYFPDKAEAEYARGWSVTYHRSYKVLRTTVESAGGHATAGSRHIESTYVLNHCGAPEPELTGDLAGAGVITIPTKTLADGGSVLYAALERLDVAESLVGEAERFIGPTEAPHFPKVSAQIASGKVAELGYDVNLEALADADPDFYTNYAGDQAMFAKIEELGIPVVYYFPYTESPLGAAEQLKFTSLFFNREAEANAIFDPIEQRYQALEQAVSAKVAKDGSKPTVVVGVIGSSGEVTTNQNDRFEEQLIRAAGGTALPDLPGGGKETLSLEAFLDIGADADFWLDLVFFPKYASKAEYLAADPRLDVLKALHSGDTFHRIGARGQDYFLNGAVDADVMLTDAVSLLHPELAPDHQLVYLGAVSD